MSLATGKSIHGYKWTVLPLGDEVINRVNQMAEDEGQPLVTENFLYEWSLGDEMTYEEEEESVNEEVGDLLQTDRIDVPLLEIDDDSESDDSDSDYDKPPQMIEEESDSDSDNDSDDDDDDGGDDEQPGPLIPYGVDSDSDDGGDSDDVEDDTGDEHVDDVTHDVTTVENNVDIIKNDVEQNVEAEPVQPTLRSSRRPGLRNT